MNFVKGDWVRLVDAEGLESVPASRKPRLRDEAYEVLDTSGSLDAVLLPQLGWWSASRFEKVPAPDVQRNPCAEVAIGDISVDWKSRYEKQKKENDLLHGMVKGMDDAFNGFYAILEKAGVLPTLDGLQKLAAEHKRMERALFLATHYNWGRNGLTWEDAARDMLNYALQGLGQELLSETETLIPHRPMVFFGKAARVVIGDKLIEQFHDLEFDITFDRALPPYHNPRKAENDCPDKVEPAEQPFPPGSSYLEEPSAEQRAEDMQRATEAVCTHGVFLGNDCEPCGRRLR